MTDYDRSTTFYTNNFNEAIERMKTSRADSSDIIELQKEFSFLLRDLQTSNKYTYQNSVESLNNFLHNIEKEHV
jgi:hypothetical protein